MNIIFSTAVCIKPPNSKNIGFSFFIKKLELCHKDFSASHLSRKTLDVVKLFRFISSCLSVQKCMLLVGDVTAL